MPERATAALVAALDAAGLLVATSRSLPVRVTGIADDTRMVTANSIFVAVRGSSRDGHDFLDDAVRRGAVAAVVEDGSRTTLPAMIVRDGRRAAGVAAAAFYGQPATELRLLGVTGTNGKTTTVNILRHLLDGTEGRSASLGTLGVLFGTEGTRVTGGGGLTTPGPVELQRVLRLLADSGVRRVAMEVSSHSLDQHRVEGLVFDVAVFTNLTRDHLDYHQTMEAYLAAKARLLDHLGPGGVAVVNADDAAWRKLPRVPPRQVLFSPSGGGANVRALDVRFSAAGSEWMLDCEGDRASVELPLLGDFNVANALASAAAAWTVGWSPSQIAERLRAVPQVPGRLEVLHKAPAVLRDYAHTPDALSRALDAVRPFARGRLIVVFGCGGDRDRGKRPEMGAVAEQKADFALVTSDNPRTEDPARIIEDVVAGMHRGNHEVIEDRRTAIARSLEIAGPEDTVLLAGKGHETYQIRGTQSYPFDEKEIVSEMMMAARR